MPVIGDHKDITVGGFAAVGGVSPASHRFGLMIDNVLALEVVDWDGDVHECSPDEDPERFYANLAGLGQHGVMTEATLQALHGRQVPHDRSATSRRTTRPARRSSPARSRS